MVRKLGKMLKSNLQWKKIAVLCIITALQILHGGLLSNALASENCPSFCGSIPLRHPFGQEEGCGAFPYREMLQCEGKKLRLRTVSGDFEVRTVDYQSRTITVWDPSMSTCSTVKPVSGQYFSADPLLPPSNNTVLLLHCADSPLITLRSSEICNKDSPFDCRHFYGCSAFPEATREDRVRIPSPSSCCSTDFQTLRNYSFEELQCSHYTSVYGAPAGKENSPSEWSYGIRLSFGFLDHVPDIRLCNECDKPDGYCGIGLRCICHPHECGNQLMSTATPEFASPKTISIILFWSLLTAHCFAYDIMISSKFSQLCDLENQIAGLGLWSVS